MLPEVPDLPHRWEDPGRNGQSIEPAPATTPDLVATTAEANERAAPVPTTLFSLAPSGSRSPGVEEMPF